MSTVTLTQQKDNKETTLSVNDWVVLINGDRGECIFIDTNQSAVLRLENSDITRHFNPMSDVYEVLGLAGLDTQTVRSSDYNLEEGISLMALLPNRIKGLR
jgi:hypothetical protein